MNRIWSPISDHFQEIEGSNFVTSNFGSELRVEQGPPSLVRTIEQLIDWEIADLIKKVDIIRLDGA